MPKIPYISPENISFFPVCKKNLNSLFFPGVLRNHYLNFWGKIIFKKGGRKRFFNEIYTPVNVSVDCICITWHEPLHRVYQDHTPRQTEHYSPLHYSRLGNCSVDQPWVDLVPLHGQHKLKPRRRTGLGSFDCYSWTK